MVKQALWQIYFPAPKRVPRPKFDVSAPNAAHQADLLFLPHDTPGHGRGRKTYKYALTVVDVASHFKEAMPLTSKESAEVAKAFEKIYRSGPFKWPQLLQVDPGREFMGAVTKEMKKKKNKTAILRGRVDIYRDQAIVERFNRTLAERLFGRQYAVEMRLPEGQRSTAWVKRLPEVVSALNDKVTRLIGEKPAEAIKEKAVSYKPSTLYSRPVLLNEKNYPPVWAFAISTSLASWRVANAAPQTLFGPLKFIDLDVQSSSPMSQFSTIYKMALLGVSFATSFLLFFLIPNYLQPIHK